MSSVPYFHWSVPDWFNLLQHSYPTCRAKHLMGQQDTGLELNGYYGAQCEDIESGNVNVNEYFVLEYGTAMHFKLILTALTVFE